MSHDSCDYDPTGADHDAPRAPEPALEVDPAVLGQAVASLLDDVADLNVALQDPEVGLRAILASHEEALEAILALLERQPGGPWHWRSLPVDGQRALWVDLEDWVAWLEKRYLINLPSTDYELPTCWWRHPVAVEMLTALMVSHLSAYSAQETTPSIALAEWHLRSFVPIFSTLREMKTFKDCVGQHTAPTRTARHDPEAFAEWLAQAFPAPVQPTPSEGT